MIKTGDYKLKCLSCGSTFPDEHTNTCINNCNSLIRADYAAKQIHLRSLPGMFRFSDWLPVDGFCDVKTAPVTYKSKSLAEELGLLNLYISFNGYWPEKGAYNNSCSFKELEAVPTMLRMQEKKKKGVIQVSSAGNTGRAFCEVSANTNLPVIVVVTDSARKNIWTTKPAENVLLITVKGDYTDAIEFGNKVCTIDGVLAEGGAKNPARRDGMGTTLLDGAITAGIIPDWYFQAVGSGTGAIAAYEMSMRLISDGRFGDKLPRLYLSQNDTFAPMVNAWKDKRREIIPDTDMPDAKNAAMNVYSPVLTNRTPPYGICGGLFDALSATDGIMVPVSKEKAESAGSLFEKTEGSDIDPAAAVCLASLIEAAEDGIIKPDETVLLNITGGGYKRAKEELSIIPAEVYAEVPAGEGIEGLSDEISRWVREHA
ncbi:MAG: cysteate synthase [Methanomicrobiaceae archaeon]|nr:cysteate synthase [Methanomicrobiaceae archaeon]